VGLAAPSHAGQYERRRPERTALYEVVRDNLETLYGAIDDGALDIKLAKHAKKELEGVPGLRVALPRLCAATLRIVQREPPGGVFVQGQRLLPGVHGSARGPWGYGRAR
jgi:hypothetical protein